MRFDPVARTLTLEPTDCRVCANGAAGPGRQFGRKTCAVCKGTGAGKRGKPRGCQNCFGRGLDIDFETTVPCEVCKGEYQNFSDENWCDSVPADTFDDVKVIVVRQDRTGTFNEGFLGANCFWSTTDYGAQWERPEEDDELARQVHQELCDSRVQAVKLWTREQYREGHDKTTMPVPDTVYVTVHRTGYSVRPQVANVTGAVPTNTYAAMFEE